MVWPAREKPENYWQMIPKGGVACGYWALCRLKGAVRLQLYEITKPFVGPR